MCPFVLQNQQKSNILDRLHQIMFKIIILSQIGADRYQKLIFEILLLSPPLGELCPGHFKTIYRRQIHIVLGLSVADYV